MKPRGLGYVGDKRYCHHDNPGSFDEFVDNARFHSIITRLKGEMESLV